MNKVLAVVESTARERAVLDVAAAVAGLVGGRVVRADVREIRRSRRARHILADCGRPEVLAAVLAAGTESGETCWPVMLEADKPVILVPAQARLRRPLIRRLLVPLDGTPEAAKAAAHTIGLVGGSGELELVVLHVFDETTVPRFWDQPAHSWPAWAAEFSARNGLPPEARLTVRSGLPGQRVAEAAEQEQADLVALSWAQRPDPERSGTVRATVRAARVPLLLVPVR